MTYELPPETELYRQQLEARARIFYATSGIWLCVEPAKADGQWVADLHQRRRDDPEPSAALEPYPGHPAGYGQTPQGALEEFASELDARERAREAEPLS